MGYKMDPKNDTDRYTWGMKKEKNYKWLEMNGFDWVISPHL